MDREIERNRAWRRFQDHVNNGRGMGSDDDWKPPKNWKHLYGRSLKVSRARQLGMEYPIKSGRQLLDKEIPPA